MGVACWNLTGNNRDQWIGPLNTCFIYWHLVYPRTFESARTSLTGAFLVSLTVDGGDIDKSDLTDFDLALLLTERVLGWLKTPKVAFRVPWISGGLVQVLLDLMEAINHGSLLFPDEVTVLRHC